MRRCHLSGLGGTTVQAALVLRLSMRPHCTHAHATMCPAELHIIGAAGLPSHQLAVQGGSDTAAAVSELKRAGQERAWRGQVVQAVVADDVVVRRARPVKLGDQRVQRGVRAVLGVPPIDDIACSSSTV